MTPVTCIPAYLYPSERLTFSRCTIVPGVKVIQLSGHLRDSISLQTQRLPAQPEFGITHAIYIDETEYLKSLRDRLQREGAKMPDFAPVEPTSLAKQSILSLVFAGRVSFAFQGSHRLDVTTVGSRKNYQAAGYSHGPLYQLSSAMGSALLDDTGSWQPIDPRRVRQFGHKLDRYFRSGMYWTDRLASAISYFWNAMCTPFPEQSFLSLTTALECLLSTKPMEITHTLAERCAVLVAREPSRRVSMYRTVKELYRIRSNLVHGRVAPKKGRQNWESLLITAKRSNVPISSLRLMLDVTISAITNVMANLSLLRIIQTKRNEDKIRQELDDYFTKALFHT